MLPWYEPASIFMGVIGGTAIILIIIYICIKKGMCFCDVEEGKTTTEIEAEYFPLATEDDGTDSVISPSMISSPAAFTLAKKSKLAASSNPEIQMIGADNFEAAGVVSIKKKEARLDRTKSQSLENFSGTPMVSLTLQYSRKDMFLVVAIHSVHAEDETVLRDFKEIGITAVLLPDKKFRVKTGYIKTDNPHFETKFKFSSVSRKALFASALRIRLYGRPKRLGIRVGRQICIGEVNIHLADIAQRETALKTTRPLTLKKIGFK